MFELFVIVLCLVLNAFLAATEMAFITVRKSILRELVKRGNREASIILKLRENPERTLSVIQIGLTLVSALAAAVGGAGAEDTLGPILQSYFSLGEKAAQITAILIVVFPLTYLSVVVGELVPKALALRYPVLINIKTAHWLQYFDGMLSPIVSFLEWSTKLLTKLIRLRGKSESSPSQMNVELEDLSHQTRQYVLNLVNIEKMRVDDVYVPWENVVYLDFNQPFHEVEQSILHSGHTRLPVMRDAEVIGLINTKEFMVLKQTEQTEWQSILRPTVNVETHDLVLKALLKMQEKRSHLSTVYHQKKLIGIVTMEDILEEVIGDIFDEDDDGIIRKLMSKNSKIRGLWKKK